MQTLFPIYCTDIIAIARRRGVEVHSYADDTQQKQNVVHMVE